MRFNKSTLLSITAVGGLIGTTILTAKAAPEANRRLEKAKEKKGEELTFTEKVSIAAPVYIPPAALCAGTAMCIMGANALNRKQEASLISAYAVLEQCYKDYRETLVDLHGPAADEEVLQHMAVRQRYDFHATDIDFPDKYLRWYEPISGQWFEAYERTVMDAEYHFNRNYALGFGVQTVNNLLYFLNLPDMGEEGEKNGWRAEDEIYWIDFEHVEKHDDKGIYYEIWTIFDPVNVEEM